MANSLKYNAYHVLGLDTSASSKQILQRSNEIVQRLKIEDVPVYHLDIPAFGRIRTESAVKDAVRRLQSPKLRIQEYFFWFKRDDNLDKAALDLLAKQDYSAAAQMWDQAATASDDRSFQCARGVALARTLALAVPAGQERISASLQSWKTLVESEAFWRSFARTYKFDGEYAASDDVFADFRRNVRGYLSDVFAELQEACKSSEYIYRFQKLFAEKGARVEREILDPAFQAIQSAVGTLKALDVGESARFDGEIAGRVKLAISEIQESLNKTIDAGLFEDSETKIIRDLAADSIRRIAINLSHQDELIKALKLAEIAARIAGTESAKSMLAAEVTQVQNLIVERDNNSLSLDIPGTFGGGKIVFSNSYLIYDNRKVFYKDVVSIAYQATTQSINLIPISQSYSYMVATTATTISISFGTTLYIDNARKRDIWARLAGVSGHLIEPQIVEKLVRRIFQDGGTVNIGGVEFDREGYHRSRALGRRDAVLWRETVYTPVFASGNVTLWKEKGGKAASFTTVPMSTANAVVLPEFVKSCVAVVRSHARQ